MDQVKEFIRQCIKYRFWISVSVAALFGIIAYFLGSGPVQAKAKTETDAINGAHKDVKQYTLPGIANDQYKPLVEEKKQILDRDVNKAWKELYTRQAPLLTWPERVQKRFQEWGRKWPENVAESAVELAKVDYVMAYPEYVDVVYKSFRPFDNESGEGVVAAPPKEMLLKPVPFDVNKLPDLGKIWAAQERLWIQRTALDVVAKVNRNAKDWDSAIIKQINLLEAGSNMAQDQQSIAKGDTLEEAEAINAPGTETEESGADAAASNPMANMMGGMGRRMMETAGPGMGGGGSSVAPENIFYVKPQDDKGQFKILPVLMSVLVDQDHYQDFLVELENSPMSIQVMDIELQKPSSRVTKPEKGAMQSFSGYGDMMMGGMMRGMGGRLGMGGEGMSGYGGMMSGYGSMMNQMMGGMMRGMGGKMGEMGGMGGVSGSSKQGTNKRDQDRGKKRAEETKAVEKAKGPSLFDPHYDILELKIYAQARFYNTPPADAETEAEPSPGEAAAAKTEPAEKSSEKSEATGAEPAKTEPAKAEPAKSEPAKTEAASNPESPKAEAASAVPAKPEPAKVEPAKPEPAKPAEPGPGTPKT
jgi:hypothetical protein